MFIVGSQGQNGDNRSELGERDGAIGHTLRPQLRDTSQNRLIMMMQ